MSSVVDKLGSDLESLCKGCCNECNQKCVIDNHEVEILHGPPSFDASFSEMACCPGGRVGSLSSVGSDFCTPRPTEHLMPKDLRSRTVSGMGAMHFGLDSDRERPLLASPRVLRRGISLPAPSKF
eukprot:TRINITY_DN57530_c0_g1_i1.p2 TRINITY_DN57530_c0_g1~~TRINITY_DN57530_c0_g1_i1.p2  ORF type:complete len:125 (-),score=16.13 TRINITY_DN57530_c0_g1_i1:884-1258(-)